MVGRPTLCCLRSAALAHGVCAGRWYTGRAFCIAATGSNCPAWLIGNQDGGVAPKDAAFLERVGRLRKMAPSSDLVPAGVEPIDGVLHHLSERSVEDTVVALSLAIEETGAKIFVAIDQAAEAEEAALELRPTRLIVFGNPRAGTSVMGAVPPAALDLPLKLLVWQAEDGQTWVTCVSGEWLCARYGIPQELGPVLSAPENLARRVSS